jgi:hypothetical protein
MFTPLVTKCHQIGKQGRSTYLIRQANGLTPIPGSTARLHHKGDTAISVGAGFGNAPS